MSDNEELDFLKSSRSRWRTKCTKRCKIHIENQENLTKFELDSAITELSEIKSKLDSLDSDIHRLMHKAKITEKDMLTEYSRCDEYEEHVRSTLCDLREVQAVQSEAVAAAAVAAREPSGDASVSAGQIKLPQIPLPEYNHADGDSFENFISNFEDVLNKYKISNFEKYVYLERQVKGEALTLIKSLRGEERSYDEAKMLLEKAFASPTVQKFETLQKLANINLKFNGN